MVAFRLNPLCFWLWWKHNWGEMSKDCQCQRYLYINRNDRNFYCCWEPFAGAYAKLRTKDYCPRNVSLSVCLCAWWARLPLDLFVWNLIFEYFSKTVKKIQVPLKSDKSNGYFIQRPMYIYDNISLISSQNEKFSGQNLWAKSKHTFYVQ